VSGFLSTGCRPHRHTKGFDALAHIRRRIDSVPLRR
jgi:hypothetical protein